MYKTTLALTALALTAFGWQQRPAAPPLPFEEGRMTLEYSATSGEAAVIVEAESEESLDSVAIRNREGALVFELRAESGQPLQILRFAVEARAFASARVAALGSSADEVYELRGRTTDGRAVLGSAVLSHRLPRPPALVYPLEGAVDVPTDPRLTWVPVPEALHYQVILEQDENDGLTVQLPAGTSSFQVPPGVLASGTRTQLEVGAIGRNGNRTVVEAAFTTR